MCAHHVRAASQPGGVDDAQVVARQAAHLVEQVGALGRKAAGELVHLVRHARCARQQLQARLVLNNAAALQAGHLE